MGGQTGEDVTDDIACALLAAIIEGAGHDRGMEEKGGGVLEDGGGLVLVHGAEFAIEDALVDDRAENGDEFLLSPGDGGGAADDDAAEGLVELRLLLELGAAAAVKLDDDALDALGGGAITGGDFRDECLDAGEPAIEDGIDDGGLAGEKAVDIGM